MLRSRMPTICILIKNYYDVDKIETIKARIAKLPDFVCFISPQYMNEPKYDVYVISDDPTKMLMGIHGSSLYDDIEDITVQEI